MNGEIAARIYELTESGVEGLAYISDNQAAGYYDLAIPVFLDVLAAFASMERTIYQFGVDTDDVVASTKALRHAFDRMVSAYEKGEFACSTAILETMLFPLYLTWQRQLRHALSDRQPWCIPLDASRPSLYVC